MAAAMGFPMGMRFRPSDVEKITFLLCKVTGHPLPCGDFMIGTADLYGEKEPWEILGDSDEGELCFFTMLKKIGKNNNRFSRNVGNGGTWANKGQKAPIYGGKRGGLIGYKRCFRYENKEVDDQNGTWLLKEYTLPDYMGKVKEEYALCVLKRKGSKTPPHVVEESIGFDNNYLLLGSGSGSENHQQESNYNYHACGLRDIAEQFVREEQSTNLPYFHSQAQDAATIISSYY